MSYMSNHHVVPTKQSLTKEQVLNQLCNEDKYVVWLVYIEFDGILVRYDDDYDVDLYFVLF
eukprot:3897018-Ditylum_brightwellii.AAC.1